MNARLIVFSIALALTSAVSAAVPRIVIDVPETVNRAVAFQGVVSARDGNDAIVSSYTGTVSFLGTDGIVFPPDYTFTPADQGSHTFTFTVNRGGYHVITVEDVSDNTTGSSDSFYVACPELTASASNSGPTCPNASGHTNLMASSNQAGVQFYWSGPHGWFSFEQNPSAPLPGTYFLEVTNSLGCTATATTTVETLALPPMHVVLSTSRLCGEGIVTATVEDATHYSDYLWSLGSPNFGTIISGQGTATVQIDTGVPESTVAFPIFVEATYTPSGCRIASQGDIDLDARPTAAIVTASSTCPNATLTATTPTQPFVTYSWSIDNGTIRRDMGPEIQYVANSSGDVILTVRVVRSDSCDTTDTAVVTVEQQPAILTQPQSTNIAAGQTATLSVDASGSALYFVWFEGLRGDRTHPVASGPSRTYTTPPLNETTMYWVEAQSACGAASSRNAVVSVSARRRAARH